MAVGLRFFNEKIWLDEYFMTLTFKEKFIWMYLITKKSTGGIFSENIASIEGVLNSTVIIEKIDNEEDYNESDYVTRKDISMALRKFDADKKLIKMEDGFYFFVNFYQNQNFKSQNNLEGVMARTEELITKNKNIAEYLRLYPIYFEQLGDEIIEQLKKETTKKNKDISLGYKQRMFLKYANLHDKVKVFFSKKVTDYLQANLSMNYTYLYTKSGTKSGTKSQPSQNQVGDNYNLNLNPNFNFNFNLKEKLIVKDLIIKNKETNIESSKNPSLGGQVFVDSSAEAKISARAKEKKKKEEEETREERKARKQKEREDACDLALTLMKIYKGVELRRKLKKVLQPYEPEEYDQVMETPRARYWNIPAKQYYFSERSIPDAQIEQAERVVEKVNEIGRAHV